MDLVRTEFRQCFSCMEEHEVKIIRIEEKGTFKGENVTFEAFYEYCENTDEYSETEEYIKVNNLSQKDAYRAKVGLLTSSEIRTIREKYSISQKDFSEVLGWGMATITRYENHQVQDRAHDDILRKISSDPKWFLEMLERVKEKIISKYAYYQQKALELLNRKMNPYVQITLNYSVGNFNFKKEKDIYMDKVYSASGSCEPRYNVKLEAIENSIAVAA